MTGGTEAFGARLYKGQGKIQVISPVFCVNKTSQTTWKTKVNPHKESEEILWSQREVRPVTSDLKKYILIAKAQIKTQ